MTDQEFVKLPPSPLLIYARMSPFGDILNPSYKDDAGLDLIVTDRVLLMPDAGAPADVPCGVRMALPDTVCALVISRSSAVRRGIIVVPTLIDPGYRGDLFIFAYNMTKEIIEIMPGARIAQLLPVPVTGLRAANMIDLGMTNLPPSDRGTRGFGSTGGAGYGQAY